MELAVDDNNDQKHKYSDDGDRYNPIRSHPVIVVSRPVLQNLERTGDLYLRAIPRSVFTLLST